jgi:hypothetical protein
MLGIRFPVPIASSTPWPPFVQAYPLAAAYTIGARTF